MKLQILGTGCAKCKELAERAAQAAQEMGVDADIEKVADVKEIMKFSILFTPGLVVNGKVKAAGRVPSVAEIKDFIQAAEGA